MSESTAVTVAAKPRSKAVRTSRKRQAVMPEVVPVTAPEPAADPMLMLAAELGIDQAGSLREQLAQRLDDTSPVLLDASEVQRVHTAAMQLFCLFCSDRRDAGREVRWQRPSPALRSAAALLGVTTLLQIAQEPAA